MTLPNPRHTNLLIFLGCCGLMGGGFIFQYALYLEPCPLCMSQRVFIVLTGVLGLIAFLHSPAGTGIKLYALAGLATSIAGGSVSARQVYLQGLPADQVPACGPGFEYMLDTFPMGELMQAMLMGDGNCAEVVWSFMGISIPGWTLVAFAGLALFQLWQLYRD